MNTPGAFAHDRTIAVWLAICCATIFCMVVLGGVTRLTGSGLSMVEWAPILGVLPPLNEIEWQAAFEKYQAYPEYQLKNMGMDLAGFKGIFWLEYFHRLLGRGIGLLFALPFLYFLVRGRIDRALLPKLVALFVLGGLQGLMGWYMVQSGMVNDPHVSQYRLTAHLLLAIVIYAWMFWLMLDLFRGRGRASVMNGWVTSGYTLTGLVLLTIASGGFVAGLRAGFTYNTFPLMNGKLIPDGLMLMEPVWRNFFENITTVQFDHRLLAMLLVVLVGAFWWSARRRAANGRVRLALDLLLAALVVQISLGIATLLLVVPIPLAAAHQAGAVVLLSAILNAVHVLRIPQDARVSSD